jgi:hypothetical protein
MTVTKLLSQHIANLIMGHHPVVEEMLGLRSSIMDDKNWLATILIDQF